jgi:hypothetical protein
VRLAGLGLGLRELLASFASLAVDRVGVGRPSVFFLPVESGCERFELSR